MLMMTSACAAASRGDAATSAPSAANGLDFSALRLKTVSGNPLTRSRRAMPEPMMPRPKNAMRGLFIKSGERSHADQFVFFALDAQRISQRAPKAGKFNNHLVAVRQLDSCTEAQTASAKIVDVQIAGTPMAFKF